MSVFFLQKISVFCPKKYLYSMQKCESCVRDFLVLFSVFVRQKVTVTENITSADSVSGIRPPDCSKLAKNPKNDNDVTIFRHDVNVNFFWLCFVSLVKFSYWSTFHVNIFTGSGIMTIFFYKGLTRNPEIEIPFFEFCSVSGDWGKLWKLNLQQVSLIECYWMLQNSRVTAFTVSELLRENQLGRVKLPPSPSPPRLGLSNFLTENLNEICGDIWCCQKWWSDREIIAKCSFLYIPHCTWNVIKPCGKQWNC